MRESEVVICHPVGDEEAISRSISFVLTSHAATDSKLLGTIAQQQKHAEVRDKLAVAKRRSINSKRKEVDIKVNDMVCYRNHNTLEAIQTNFASAQPSFY